MSPAVDRKLIEDFLENTNHTDFQLLARGNGGEGAVVPTIEKSTRLGKTQILTRYNGLRAGITVNGQTRVFRQAVNFAQGEDWVRAIDALVSCSYFNQVELHPNAYIASSIDGHEVNNPLTKTLEPLIWRCEDDGQVTTHGGAREGTGPLPALTDPVSLNFRAEKVDVDKLKARAAAEGKPYAELLREMLKEMLG